MDIFVLFLLIYSGESATVLFLPTVTTNDSKKNPIRRKFRVFR